MNVQPTIVLLRLRSRCFKIIIFWLNLEYRTELMMVRILSAFRDRGSPSRRVSVPRAPAQMGRARGRARRGEKRGGRRRA
jgi:hypothetical protein